MKYEILKQGKISDVEVEQDDKGSIKAVVNGQIMRATVTKPKESLYLIQQEEKVFQVQVVNKEDKDSFDVIYKGKVNSIQILSKYKRKKRELESTGLQQITSPIPGRVVRIVAKVGDIVEAGQGIVVVEAMKMQNEMSTIRGGIVSEICVEEGQVVKACQILAVVSPQ